MLLARHHRRRSHLLGEHVVVQQHVAPRLQVLQADAGVCQGDESFPPLVGGAGRKQSWDVPALEAVQVIVRSYLQSAGTGGSQLWKGQDAGWLLGVGAKVAVWGAEHPRGQVANGWGASTMHTSAATSSASSTEERCQHLMTAGWPLTVPRNTVRLSLVPASSSFPSCN